MRCSECDAVLLPGEATTDDLCSECAETDPLVECPVCGRVGLPKRIRDHDCPPAGDDPYEFIVPREDHISPEEVLSEMLAHAHTHGTWLGYYDLRLYKVGFDGGGNVWDVHTANSTTPVDVLNCDAFQTASDLEAHLRDIAAEV